jgi:hypothetical protein
MAIYGKIIILAVSEGDSYQKAGFQGTVEFFFGSVSLN